MLAVAALVVDRSTRRSKAAIVASMAPGRAHRPRARLRPHPGDQQRDRLRALRRAAATRWCSRSPRVALALILGWFALDTTRPLAVARASACSPAGALGNLADRVRDGAVTDFLDPPLWPAFNLADVAITVGVVVIALAALAPPAAAAEPQP